MRASIPALSSIQIGVTLAVLAGYISEPNFDVRRGRGRKEVKIVPRPTLLTAEEREQLRVASAPVLELTSRPERRVHQSLASPSKVPLDRSKHLHRLLLAAEPDR
jgi:hypothetical protein